MANNGMTIDGLNTVTSLTAQDEVPVWDNEASDEPTRKITGQNLASSVKTLGSLLGTSDVANDLTTTAAGKVLDARQGKALQDEVDTLNSNLSKYKTKRVSGTTGNTGAISTELSIYNYIFGIRENNNDNVAFQGFVAYGGVWFIQTTSNNTTIDVDVLYRENA